MADSRRAPRAADSGTRARDIDRAQVSTMLDAAYAEGQLGAQEYHDRVARAATARTLGELSGLTADLQSPAVFGGPSVTHGAADTVRVPDGAISHASIRFSSNAEGGLPEITIHVKNEAEQSGHFTIAPSGEPITVHPNTR
ncbi:DUF1707 domain-containing protein [Nocardia sp. NPDC058658]|uniref:DUF1707 SHOCT-like domain-containing protein n=1 Tax=Nocardia sp. NPDC058658 TaxID=3346580 RepID=UPI00365EDBC8